MRTLHVCGVEVGVRELRENLAEWLDRAAAGEEILVTERGKPKARAERGRVRLDRLVREGRITPAQRDPQPAAAADQLATDGPTLIDYLCGRAGRSHGRGQAPSPERTTPSA